MPMPVLRPRLHAVCICVMLAFALLLPILFAALPARADDPPVEANGEWITR